MERLNIWDNSSSQFLIKVGKEGQEGLILRLENQHAHSHTHASLAVRVRRNAMVVVSFYSRSSLSFSHLEKEGKEMV